MAQNTRLADWLVLALLVVIWGSSFAMIKIAVTSLDAMWVMALRLTVAAIVLVPYAAVSSQSLAASPGVWSKFAWLGLIGNVAPFFLISWGTHFVSSGVSGLLMASVPLFVVVFAHFILPDERLSVMKVTGFLIGFLGIVVLIGPENIFSFSISGNAVIGELSIIAGGLCYAIHGVSAKHLGLEHPVKQSAGVCVAGAAIGLLLALLVDPTGLAGTPSKAIWATVGLGLLPTAFATLLMYWLMDRIGPTFIAYSNYLVPVFAVFLGAAVMNEQLSWNVLLALALILFGIAISRIGRLPWQERVS